MRTLKWTVAALLTIALFGLTTALSLAAPAAPRLAIKAHSDAWHDFYLDQHNAERVTSNVAETPHEKWRGGLAEQRAETSVAAPRKLLRGAVHGEDWDSVYFDRTVNTSITVREWDYTSAALLQGCHAQADHKVQARQMVLAIH